MDTECESMIDVYGLINMNEYDYQTIMGLVI